MSPLAPLLLAVSAALPANAPDATTVQLRGHRFVAELATDDAHRARGLMMRTALAPDRGMLFVFPDTDQRWFWMKDTLIALDILYFDAQRQLVSLQAKVPPCKGDPCPSYSSDAPARYVLELPAGTAARIGARAGDVLTIEGPVGTVQ